MIIFSLSGKKQSGKSTACEGLKQILTTEYEIHQDYITEISFAEALKQIVIDCFIPWEMTVKDLDLEVNKNMLLPCGKTIREVLQIVGTDMFRDLWEDCWINIVKKKLQKAKDDEYKYAIVTDTRFPNEADMLGNMDAYLFRFTRAPLADYHISETALDAYMFDYIVDNVDMTIEEQTEELSAILSTILLER